jgi:hypothetical protein
VVAGGALELDGVLEDDDAVEGAGGGDLVEDGVDEGGLAAGGAAGDEDVAAGADGGGEGGAVAGGEDAGLDVLVEGVDDGGGFAEVEDGGGGERRDEALEAGVAEEFEGERTAMAEVRWPRASMSSRVEEPAIAR